MKSLSQKTVVTLGVFDGVHRGHRQLLQKVIRRARKKNWISLAYTFDPHPAARVSPSASPLMLNTLAQRVDLIREQGIEKVFVQKFDRTFAQKTPREFFEQILLKTLNAGEIFVGYDFTFGVRRSGTTETLRELAQKSGIELHVVSPILLGETLVSSTQIRNYLAQGRLTEATDLLQRSYFMEGTVMRGLGRGRKLSAPTANLKSENDLILPHGVYATWTWVQGKRWKSVTNIGHCPTFDSKSGTKRMSVETHLLDTQKNLYGQKIRIEFIRRIREEKRFNSPGELSDQIQKDIALSRKILLRKRS